MSKLKRSDFENAGERIARLPEERRSRIMDDANAMAQEMHLREIRKVLSITQAELSEKTGIAQGDISRVEKADLAAMKLKTLERYVGGMGGELKIVADFPDGTTARIPLHNGKPVKSRIKASVGQQTKKAAN
ncbi:XRE family transcriptional regulator [Notoacmeibacter ruber]|uniref:Transcriptional regulator n=1 Tax=Notoacmeibacter ruber TaxID=2670375 RepID=A0A3L7J354_9HYPH|nr:XRE family transcriptional regulator [Notoacmeibacter ruber]RLQ84967.1 transcriptional regulator [Notoacmeibacter ruber]